MTVTITKKMLWSGILKIGTSLVYTGEMIIKKSAIKNIKNFKNAAVTYKWLKEPSIEVQELSETMENGVNMQILSDLQEPLHKFTRSELLLNRGDDSPLAIFVCPEIGEVRFIDDEYIFNLGINELYSSDSGTWLINSDNKDDWTICLFGNRKNTVIEAELEKLALCIFSEENV